LRGVRHRSEMQHVVAILIVCGAALVFAAMAWVNGHRG
jgi:hypothetical protein